MQALQRSVSCRFHSPIVGLVSPPLMFRAAPLRSAGGRRGSRGTVRRANRALSPRRLPGGANRGVTANANVTWLKVCQLIVAAVKPSKARYAPAAPIAPPASARTSDSTSTEKTTGPAPKPRARNVAISRVRAAHRAVHRVQCAEERSQRHHRRR